MFPIQTEHYKTAYIGKLLRNGNRGVLNDRFITTLTYVLLDSQKSATDEPSKIKNHHSPSWVIQACDKALHRMNCENTQEKKEK